MKKKFKNKILLLTASFFVVNPSKSMLKGQKDPTSQPLNAPESNPLTTPPQTNESTNQEGDSVANLSELSNPPKNKTFDGPAYKSLFPPEGDWRYALNSKIFSQAHFENFSKDLQNSIDIIKKEKILIGASFVIDAFFSIHSDGNVYHFMNDLMEKNLPLSKIFNYHFMMDFIKNYLPTSGSPVKDPEDMLCHSKEVEFVPEKELQLICKKKNHTLSDIFKILVIYRELLLKKYVKLGMNCTAAFSNLFKKINTIDSLIDPISIVKNAENPARGFEHAHEDRAYKKNFYLDCFSFNDIPSETSVLSFSIKNFKEQIKKRRKSIRENIVCYINNETKKLRGHLNVNNFKEQIKNTLIEKLDCIFSEIKKEVDQYDISSNDKDTYKNFLNSVQEEELKFLENILEIFVKRFEERLKTIIPQQKPNH